MGGAKSIGGHVEEPCELAEMIRKTSLKAEDGGWRDVGLLQLHGLKTEEVLPELRPSHRLFHVMSLIGIICLSKPLNKLT